MSESWFAEHALLPDGPARHVRFDVVGGRFAAVTPGADATGATRLPGVALPGFANCHSHAFHRALRGRTHGDGGTFWTWRDAMYAFAVRLDPETYLDVARAVYAEMALAGITAVAEFQYLHHAPGGIPYAHPNAMAEALRAAAAEAGIRLTLLDTCYLVGGLTGDGYVPLRDVQLRFGDSDVHAWEERVAELREDDSTRVGVAVHSVRAVPESDLAEVARVAAGRPLHVHLSEQPAENEACLQYLGRTPTAVLDDAGVLGPSTTAVHATHLTGDDVRRLGESGARACICPTTERDLADGIGPARRLADAGVPLSLGTDQHALIDMFGEARGLEMDERLQSLERGRFTPQQLLAAATAHASIGWPDAGTLAAGSRADLVAVRLDTTRTAGCDPAQVLMAASASDVDTVIADGRVIVSRGRHHLGDVGDLLTEAIGAAWRP
jgi:formiminoglutamate deiminase